MADQNPGLSVLYTTPISDVPGRLRLLADEIEAEPNGVRSCVVLVDWMGKHNDYAVDLRCHGVADPVRALGILHIAATALATTINGGPVYRSVNRDG